MRFVRLIAGILLLTIGLPVLLVGGALWTVSQHRGANGAYGGTLDRVETTGPAVVVPDLAGLLGRDAPFLRTGRTGLRVVARTGSDPAFVGLAPAAEVANYLAGTSHARIDQVSVTRGRLPVRVSPADQPGTAAPLGPPGEQRLWLRHGMGVLDLTPDDLRGPRLSLVVMRPDAHPGLAVDLRAEVRPGWLDPVFWSLLVAGILLALLGIVLLARPVRPREVVFVVEPSQVPALAARLGIAALADIGRPPDRSDPAEPVPAPDCAGDDELVSASGRAGHDEFVGALVGPGQAAQVGPPDRIGRAPDRIGRRGREAAAVSTGSAPVGVPSSARPATLADVLTPTGGSAGGGRLAERSVRLTWPPINPAAGVSPASAGTAGRSSGDAAARADGWLGSVPTAPSARIPAPTACSGRTPAPAPAPAPVPAPPPAPVPAPTPVPPLPVPAPPMPAPPRPAPVPAASIAPGSTSAPVESGSTPPGPVPPGAVPPGPVPSGSVEPNPVRSGLPVAAADAAVTPKLESGSARRISLRPAAPGVSAYDVGRPGTARTALNRPKGYDPATDRPARGRQA